MGIDPRYYLDEMSQDEVVAVMKARNEHYNFMTREDWEQTRLQCFYSIVAMGSKIKKPKELFKLPWDGDKKAPKDAPKTQRDAMKKLLELRNKR